MAIDFMGWHLSFRTGVYEGERLLWSLWFTRQPHYASQEFTRISSPKICGWWIECFVARPDVIVLFVQSRRTLVWRRRLQRLTERSWDWIRKGVSPTRGKPSA